MKKFLFVLGFSAFGVCQASMTQSLTQSPLAESGLDEKQSLAYVDLQELAEQGIAKEYRARKKFIASQRFPEVSCFANLKHYGYTLRSINKGCLPLPHDTHDKIVQRLSELCWTHEEAQLIFTDFAHFESLHQATIQSINSKLQLKFLENQDDNLRDQQRKTIFNVMVTKRLK